MEFRDRVKLIKKTLSVLLEPGSISELRIPRADGGPLVGLFDDVNEMAAAAAKYSGKVPGIYVPLNQLTPSGTTAVDNKLSKAASAVRDADIQRRRWLPIDFDPVRPSNTSSTDAQHEAAIALAKECRDWLRNQGWPEPVLADSGNGAHLLLPIDLPNDGMSDQLVRNCLAAMALRFSTGTVALDSGNGNASRLTRVYGTMNRKGNPTAKRPHRRSRLLKVPDELHTVGVELLNQFAAALPLVSTEKPARPMDIARWLAACNLLVAFDAPWSNGGHKWILSECPWDDSHKKSAFVVQFRNGGIAAGCLHKSCVGNNWPMLRALYQRPSGTLIKSGCAGESEKTLPVAQGSAQTRNLLTFASDLRLFSTPQGESYVTFQVGNHGENHRIESKAFKQWLHLNYFRRTNASPRPHAVQEVMSHFDAVARYDCQREPVFLRVAADRERFFLDLCDEQWRAVEFSRDGWKVVKDPATKFRRLPGMLSLPTPVRGGDINELSNFLNLRSRGDWTLFVETLLAALFPGPYPVLGIHGEPGSAKSTTSRIFRTMIDPHVSASRAMPKDIRDLMIMANNGWVLSFDNLSHVPLWFSDCLCRLSTGGGFSTREIYTNSDEVIFDGQRPVILNGIEELATRTDLLDRSVLLDLPVIRNWKEERTFWKEFEAAHPRLLGALLDVAVSALRNLQSVQLTEKPRMADFAVLATAAEPALGLSTGAFMEYYARNRQSANAVALEVSPIANIISNMAERSWHGTAEALLERLFRVADEETRKRRAWPKNAKVLSGMLRRLAPALRRAGVDVKFWRDQDRLRTRRISIERQRSKG